MNKQNVGTVGHVNHGSIAGLTALLDAAMKEPPKVITLNCPERYTEPRIVLTPLPTHCGPVKRKKWEKKI